MGINQYCRNPKRVSSFLTHLFLFSYFLSLQLTYAVNETIVLGQSIKDGETIISNGKIFELGFFSPINSTRRYVGIWYYKIPGKNVVWVANRNNPVLDFSGILRIGNDNNLHIFDGNGISHWSTNTSDIPKSPIAVLLDSGNFVLAREKDVDDPNIEFWQSFDHPTDTFLPGMRIGSRSEHDFVSWRRENDPSLGSFSAGMDNRRSPQILIWEGTERIWRSGLWNGQKFIGIPSMRSQYLYGFRPVPKDGEIYFTYTLNNGAQLMRLQLRWDGQLVEHRWDRTKQEWSVFWSQNITGCNHYNTCGNFGSCSMSNDRPVCSCLHGFIPKLKNKWDNGNWSSGCIRRKPLQCNQNNTGNIEADGFFGLERMKVPDFAEVTTGIVESDCRNKCLKNCSCKGYAYDNGISCLTWNVDLADIQKFQDGGYTLYIRLNKSELDDKKKVSKIIIIVAVILSAVFSSIFAFLLWRKRNNLKGWCRKENKVIEPVNLTKSKETSREMLRDFSGEESREGEEGSGPELPLFSFSMIEAATNNFALSNKLGEGGFGHVYKGILPCGAEMAVKRLSRKSGQGLEEFKTEIILIAKLQHRNLVRILGCCIEEEEKMLVYEYMPNKSLDAFIFDSRKQVLLDWPKRFNIIEGIARGLLYLHRDSRLRIIHRDLKASNILLDGEMNPKISDFGMAKIFGGNQNQANTTRVVGTYGYMSPEYAMEGLFSVKSDVYSFGVLLLEIVCGKRNSYFNHMERFPNLLGHAWQLWSEGRAMELADTSIQNSYVPSEVVRCLHVGLLCVQDSAVDRPNMSSVVLMLESETATLPIPKPPTFTIRRSATNTEMGVEEHEIVSTNDVTVSVIIGR